MQYATCNHPMRHGLAIRDLSVRIVPFENDALEGGIGRYHEAEVTIKQRRKSWRISPDSIVRGDLA